MTDERFSLESPDERAQYVVSMLGKAAAHDIGCEDEGEGECCMVAWRHVMIAALLAKNVTDDEIDADDFRYNEFRQSRCHHAERTQPQEMAMARLTTTASAAVEAWAAMAQPADDHSAARYLRMARLIDELDLNLNAYESLFTSITEGDTDAH